MSKGKLIKVCGECANYDWKKHRCKLGCNEGEPQEPFYSDCPLPTVDTDQICKQNEVIDEFTKRLKEAPIKCGLPLFGLSTKGEIEEYFNSIMLQVRDAIDNIATEMKGGAE